VVTGILYSSSNQAFTDIIQWKTKPFTQSFRGYPQITQNSNLTFDQECKENGEWENVGRNIFIKRTAVYYFSDANLIHLLLVSKSDLNYSYQLEVQVCHKSNASYGFTFKLSGDEVYSKGYNTGEYNLTAITAKFSIENSGLSKNKLSDIKMRVFVTEALKNEKNDYPLAVKIKL
jgi:hypothetical protein